MSRRPLQPVFVAGPMVVGMFSYWNARSRRRSLPRGLRFGGRGPKRFVPGLILAILVLLPVLVAGFVVARAEAWGSWGSGNTSIASFSVPLPIPAVLAPTKTDTTTDYYTLTMKTGIATVVPGKPTSIWGYNGTWPGPTIVAQSGRQVAVHLVNNLPESMSMHLHGGHQESISDGLPTNLVAPGGSRDYLFPTAGLTARTLWYHDHAMNTTAVHVYEGLAGLFIVKDSAEAAMNLPSGVYDVPLVLQDRTFNSDGSLSLSSDGSGDTMMVNGAPQPYFKVTARKYRFRILNGANSSFFTLGLSNGQAMTQLGTEGGFLRAPLSQSTISLAPAERADVVVDFSTVPVGTSITLRNTQGWRGSGDIMRFDVTAAATDTSTIPATLRTITPPDPAQASVTRTFTFAKDWRNGWTINGQAYDPTKSIATIHRGATEVWKFDNQSGDDHPIHLHLVNYRVLDINGQTPPAVDTAGLKETLVVPSRGTATIVARFDDYLGTFVFHCHILEHEDQGFMANFQVVP